MELYTLPQPTPLERAILHQLAGSRAPPVEWTVFPSGEFSVQVHRVPRHAYVLGRSVPPAENLVRTFLLLDTLRRSGARRITLILPYFAYGRQDRVRRSGEAVGAGTLLRLIAEAGATRVVTVDPHSRWIRRLCPVAFTAVDIVTDMAKRVRSSLPGGPCTIVATDRGARPRAAAFARGLGFPRSVSWVEKVRLSSGRVRALRLHGRRRGTTAVLVDDILDTGATVREAVRLLRSAGCRSFVLCVTHPLFSGQAVAVIRRLGFRRILVSDTVPLPPSARVLGDLEVVSAAPGLLRAITGST